MLVICTKSNVEFTASGFNSTKLVSDHPLFHAAPETLLRIGVNWHSDKLNIVERRLLFIAILDATGLVDRWHCAAEPEDTTIQKYMERLLITFNWIHAAGNTIPLPKVVINASTRFLDTINNWMDLWDNAKREHLLSQNQQLTRAALHKAEERLLKLIRDKHNAEDYAYLLAKWVMTVSDAPKGVHEYWISLFKLKGLDVFNANLKDLEELQTHMEDNLYPASPFAVKAFQHIRSLVNACRGGILGALTTETYSIISEDSVEGYNTSIAAAQAPEFEPKEKDYESKFKFLQAKARWNIKLRQEAEQEAASKASDEAEASTEPNPNQTELEL